MNIVSSDPDRPAWVVNRVEPAPPGESLHEFIRRHGGHSVTTRGGTLLLPSGARLTGHQRVEPPADEGVKLVRQRSYFTAHLAMVEADRDALAAALKGYAAPFRWSESRYGPKLPTGDEALAYLSGLIAEDKDALDTIALLLQPQA